MVQLISHDEKERCPLQSQLDSRLQRLSCMVCNCMCQDFTTPIQYYVFGLHAPGPS